MYQVDVEGIESAKIKGLTRIEVLAGELKISAITVLVGTELDRFKNNISFNIIDQLSLEAAKINTSFYSDANSRVD